MGLLGSGWGEWVTALLKSWDIVDGYCVLNFCSLLITIARECGVPVGRAR